MKQNVRVFGECEYVWTSPFLISGDSRSNFTLTNSEETFDHGSATANGTFSLPEMEIYFSNVWSGSHGKDSDSEKSYRDRKWFIRKFYLLHKNPTFYSTKYCFPIMNMFHLSRSFMINKFHSNRTTAKCTTHHLKIEESSCECDSMMARLTTM